MAALTAEKATKRKISAHDQKRVYKIAANVKIYKGAMVVLIAGKAAPAATATTIQASVGRATKTYDNTGGSADAFDVEVEEGVFCLVNSGTDAVDANDVGADCYWVDDQTVSETNAGGNTQTRAGRVYAVDSEGVWVQVGLGL